jgi:hypothetical protein
MYIFQKRYSKLILLSAFISLFLVACDNDHDGEIDHPPAFYIAMSEKLTLPDALELPANLPAGNSRVATYYATGVQKYKAQAVAGTTTFQWVFVAPVADLYDITNRKVGTHSAGPTWQLINSVSDSIYGQHFAPQRTAPSPDAASIDWLLLMPKAGTTPTGIFANVSYIHRIATKGGKAPATPPTNATATVEVPYEAIYRFTKKNP